MADGSCFNNASISRSTFIGTGFHTSGDLANKGSISGLEIVCCPF